MTTQSTPARHAIVIGGSMAGLLAARVLSDHADSVTILERDAVGDAPETRKGQPQTRHLHALLGRGFDILTRLFPGLEEALVAGGAVIGDAGATMRWHAFGGYRVRFASDLKQVTLSRPFLEWQVRRRVTALPNVRLEDASAVESLVADEDRARIAGVRVERRGARRGTDTLLGDLTIDATGRGSATPRLLEALGYPRPAEEQVANPVVYASRLYRRDPGQAGSRDWIFITPTPPGGRRAGGAFPVEGARWAVTLAGMAGHAPPLDERGFDDFARSLPAPDIYDVVTRSAPLSDVVAHRFPASLRRRYDRLTSFPEGLLVVGDALCSFNPVYGQGMTAAAMQALALDDLLRRDHPREGLAPAFFRSTAGVLNEIWRMAVGEDFRYPETKGRKEPGTALLNAYTARVHRATHRDQVVTEALLRVMNLQAPSLSLLRPGIAARVFLPLPLRGPRDAVSPKGA